MSGRKIKPTPERVRKMLDMHRAILKRAEAEAEESRAAIEKLEATLERLTGKAT